MTWFNYNFYPVGQGLFSSGHLALKTGQDFVFNWVYDCGTSSSRNLLSESVELLGVYLDHARNKGRIELMVLSHFDEDHINGVVQLMQKHKVHTLLLPYVPLHYRLQLALDQDLDLGEDLVGFFLDPARYIISKVGDLPPERILFVPPSDTDEPVIAGEGGGGSPDEPYLPIATERAAKDPDETSVTSGSTATLHVGMLDPSRSIRVKNFWEFVPYNDAKYAPSDRAFVDEVEGLRDKLLNATPEDRLTALQALKRKYRSLYPAGEQANLISLFMYAGPLPMSSALVGQINGPMSIDHMWPGYPFWWHGHWPLPFAFPDHKERPSVLYTGDGFLNCSTRLDALCGSLGMDRIQRVGCFQVMHHGSRKNWFAGVTGKITPWLSVIPANARPGGHPHPEVIEAFWPYGAVSVDKRRGAWVAGLVDH